jgi:hypothetical protein
MITQFELDGYVGKSIGDICQNGYTTLADNHSAHFVSHVLGYSFETTCQMLGGGKAPGAALRLNDIYGKCAKIGAWSLRPASLQPCFVFVLGASNASLRGRAMANMPRRHVGIFAQGFIWHYSNRFGRVVRHTPSQFAQHYPPPHNALFYGSLPSGACGWRP